MLLVAGLVLCSGCRSAPFPSCTTVADAEGGRALEQALVTPGIPATMCLRAVIVAGADELVLTIYAATVPPGGVRFAAVSDLGGTVFEAACADGKVDVVREAGFLPRGFLELHLIPDLSAALLPPADVTLVAVEAGGFGLLSHCGDDDLLGLPGDGPDRVRIVRGRHGDLLATIDVRRTSAASVDGQRRPLGVRIESPAGSYSARIEVLDWAPAAASASALPGSGARR